MSSRKKRTVCLALSLSWAVVSAAAQVQAAPADDPAALIALMLRGGVEGDRAVERLSYLGPQRAGPPLRALLASHDVQARIAASAALAVVRDPNAVAPLADRLLHDEDWEVRRNAADALGTLRARGGVKALGKRLVQDPHRLVRKSCVRALAAIGGGASALREAASQDTQLEIRMSALDALAASKERAATAGLKPLLEDASSMVRFAAARALAWHGEEAGRRFLLEALAQPDEEQPLRAVRVMADVPRAWAVEPLAKMLESAMPAVRVEAALALAGRGDHRARPVLAAAALGGDNRAVQALSALGGDAALAAEAP